MMEIIIRGDIEKIASRQRIFYNSGKTRKLSFRITQLKKLLNMLDNHESEILKALDSDLGKPAFEAYSTEIMPVKNELKFALNNIREWASPKKVTTPMALQPAKSVIYSEPYGVVLNIAPWNYPFQLCFKPLVPIIAAGNCAVIKPSEFAPETSSLVANLTGRYFDSNYCTVIEGAQEETQMLLRQRWDYIAFTGNPVVGRIVAKAAAENLTPTLLELGGKSPCFVHSDANIKIAAKRIVWGKFFNAGQTCTAPDYILAHRDIIDKLERELAARIKQCYPNGAKNNPDYPRIINGRHFERLESLIDRKQIVFGGSSDKSQLFIEPTLLRNVLWDDILMKEEIFGPLLPIIEYSDINEVIEKLKGMEKPLALYFFGRSKKYQEKLIESLSFGGGCINTTLMQSGNVKLPFGGVGNSGMGNYHGKTGFRTFSHQKSILFKPNALDQDLVYPPYGNKFKMLKLLG